MVFIPTKEMVKSKPVSEVSGELFYLSPKAPETIREFILDFVGFYLFHQLIKSVPFLLFHKFSLLTMKELNFHLEVQSFSYQPLY